MVISTRGVLEVRARDHEQLQSGTHRRLMSRQCPTDVHANPPPNGNRNTEARMMQVKTRTEEIRARITEFLDVAAVHPNCNVDEPTHNRPKKIVHPTHRPQNAKK